jgi:GDPmannose 4,6-dehydratase
MATKALITGIAGQDGSYLAELLLTKGYEVHGVVRRISIEDADHKLKNIRHIQDKVHIHVASLYNVLSMVRVIREIMPEECYHLAASSFVSYSLDEEISILDNNVNSTHFLLAAIREFCPGCRFYFSGSSEMFGNAANSPQDEDTPFNPRSIYGISKVAGFHLVKNYRKQYNLFACSGILYNHESPRRGYEFVTRKIVSAAVRIKLGLQHAQTFGNLEARRDWGYAPDYVEAMWLMLQAETPDDYVIASGETHSVREFAQAVFSHLGLDFEKYAQIDEELYRPAEPVELRGNPAKAVRSLQWKRTKSLKEIIMEMVETELKLYSGR